MRSSTRQTGSAQTGSAPRKYYPRRRSTYRRKTGVIRGKGAYNYFDSKNYGKYGKAGEIGGRLVGSYLGGKLGPYGTQAGAFIGQKIGGAISHYVAKNIFGSGAYTVGPTVVKNNLFKGSTDYMQECASDNMLTFAGDNQSIRVRHREYIKDINTHVTAGYFAQDVFSVNPGLIRSFPWLSKLARNFQKYKFHGLVYEFVSTSADSLNSTNTALGSVMAMSDMNVGTNGVLDNKQSLLSTGGALMCRPSQNFLLGVECDPKKGGGGQFFIRNKSVPTTEDIKTYDMCNVQVATSGFQGSQISIGSLFVIYDVELSDSIQDANGESSKDEIIDFKVATVSNTEWVPSYNPYPYYLVSANPLLDTSTYVNNATSGIPIIVHNNSNHSFIYFPPECAGQIVRMSYCVTGAVAACAPPTFVLSNCTEIMRTENPPAALANSTRFIASIYVKVVSLGEIVWPTTGNLSYTYWPYIKFTGGTGVMPANPTYCGLSVSICDPDIYYFRGLTGGIFI